MKTTRILFNSASTHAHPDAKQFNTWVSLALTQQKQRGQVSVYLVDKTEGLSLNKQYRDKDYATNVLAFPATAPSKRVPLLGDLVICVPVVLEEALAQHKSMDDHFAHLTIHGTLHLLGFDHIEPDAALHMEQLEIQMLAQLGIANPYDDERTSHLSDGVLTHHG